MYEHLTWRKPKHKRIVEYFVYNASLSMYVEWNIGAMIEWIEAHQSEVELIDFEPERYKNMLDQISLSKSHYDNDFADIDLNIPIIRVNVSPVERLVVDGHHRIYKAIRDGVSPIPCYNLTFEQQVQFVTYKRMFNWMIKRVPEALRIHELAEQRKREQNASKENL